MVKFKPTLLKYKVQLYCRYIHKYDDMARGGARGVTWVASATSGT